MEKIEVKIFHGNSPSFLEKEINTWMAVNIRKEDIVAIKQDMLNGGERFYDSICISIFYTTH